MALNFCDVIFFRPPSNVTLPLNYDDLIFTIETLPRGSLKAMLRASSYMI